MQNDTPYQIDQEIFLLLKKIIAGKTLSPAEKSLLNDWEKQSPPRSQLLFELGQPETLPAAMARMTAIEKNETNNLDAFIGLIQSAEPRPVPLIRRWIAAASILLILSATAYFWFFNSATDSGSAQQTKLPQIEAGRDGAILTLADGTNLVLDSLHNGLVTNQNGTAVILKNGQLLYQIPARNGASTAAAEVYNTMATPRGKQFQLALPDGSKVWLNAESSIKYPTSFTGKERRVEVTGEVYFEVQRQPLSAAAGGVRGKKPFIVTINDQLSVEVLGTRFNVNAYTDEATIRTTLLEGSVQLVYGSAKAILKPGQQGAVTPGLLKIPVANVQTEEVMAWKNESFHFESAGIKTILRQFARWYDVDVVYENDPGDRKYFIIIDRNSAFSLVLDALQSNEIKFRIEGKKLYVRRVK